MVVDDIHSLVNSLTPREAAYFTDYLRKRKVQQLNFYLNLFKHIRKQTNYDEKAIIKKLNDPKQKKRFSELKNYFAGYLLDSLLAFHAHTLTESKIHRMGEMASLLYEKGLYTQAMNIVRQAQTQARKYEKHYLLLELFEIERQLIKKTTTTDLVIKLNINSTQKTELFKKIQNEDQFAAINDQVFALYQELSLLKDKNKLTELEQLMRHPLLEHIDKALTFSSQLKFHYIHALKNRLSGNCSQALHHREEVKKLWDANPHMIIEMTARYRTDLSNLLSARHLTKKYNGFEQLIKLIEKQKTNASAEDDALIFREVYYLRLLFLLNNDKKQEALALIPYIEKNLEKHNKFIGKARMLNFWYNISATYFLNNHYSETLVWIKKLIESEKKSKVRSDLRDFAQLLELVLYYELDQHELLAYNLRNTRERLKNSSRLYEFETIVIANLRNLIAANCNKPLCRTIWVKFQKQLNELSTKTGMENLLGVEELILWINSKIN